MQSSGFSLVKYDTPILVSKSFGAGKRTGGAVGGGNESAKTSASSFDKTGDSGANKAEDYLNSILPPREYQDSGQLWVQYVSPIPTTRLDVIIL